ncbi:thioesterase II family protein [Chitinasiproducens palmae]|uniref:Surfactin synthase thioesterase subunit n=1 Tax=Chitinasiproducens palmae TaxID=1770053 RepID=A0A1H2PII2_9BURK|nr:alpha/beta fold hydrolase [Chitinasiproducens palmae]SDV46056.1 Surfactin synthase thioesterase subunit [Chitinasiproducens palmae]
MTSPQSPRQLPCASRQSVDGPIRLLCLPYAGGSAALFRDWPQMMPDWVEVVPVHLRGRGVRHAQAASHTWSALLDDLLEQVMPALRARGEGRYAIFGHSMGALVGLELAHALRARLGAGPAWFGASGSLAPALRTRETHWLDCNEATFLAEVRRLGGMPDSLLDNQEFMELVSPMLRADFHLCGTYDPPSRLPLDCPLLAVNGVDDARCMVPDNEPAWARETTGSFAAAHLPGGHFFINTHRPALIGQVLTHLGKALSAPAAVTRACA